MFFCVFFSLHMLRFDNLLMIQFSLSTLLDSLAEYDPLMDGHIYIHVRKLKIGHQVVNELISPLPYAGLRTLLGLRLGIFS